MKLNKKYTASIPCTLNVKPDIPLDNIPKTIYKAPNLLMRITPKETLLIQHCFNAFRADAELSDLLIESEIDTSKMPTEIADLLIKRDLALTEYNGEPLIKKYDRALSAYYAILELTQHCNCTCEHCYVGGPRNQEPEPSTKSILQRINKLDRLGIVYYEITGGEPLMRQELDVICDDLHNRNLFYLMPTNGWFISKTSDRVFQNANIIMVSIDGDRKYHDTFRGVIGLFDRAVEGLKHLVDLGVDAYIIMTVHNQNIQYVPKIINLAQEIGTKVSLQRLLPSGNALQSDLIYDSPPAPKFEKDRKVRIYRKGLKRPKEIQIPAEIWGCDMGQKSFLINVYGKVAPCEFQPKFTIGDLMEFDIDTLTTKFDALKKERKDMLKNCDNCLEDNCGGPCVFSKKREEWKK